MHSSPHIPRVGGIALLIGLMIGLSYFQPAHWLSFVLLSVLAFLTGFIEDIHKKTKPLHRLILSFLVAALALWLLDLGFYHSGSTWVDDRLLRSPLLAYSFAIIMIGGVMHALNIIDGYNGLMPGFAAIASIALLFIALKIGDYDIGLVLLMLVAALLGMLLFNYPLGKIFMGDGGAYLVGFILAICSLALVNHNRQISPWLPLVILAYPVWETLFSIYRRIVILKKSPGEPDKCNSHFIVHRYLLSIFPHSPTMSHNLVAPIFCLMSFSSLIPAVYYWDNTPVLILISCWFIALYLMCYFFLLNKEKQRGR